MLKLTKSDIGKRYVDRKSRIHEIIGFYPYDEDFPLITCQAENSAEISRHSNGGEYYNTELNSYDLISEVEPEMFVNVYNGGICSNPYSSYEHAVLFGSRTRKKCYVGTYKLVKVEK